MPASNADPVDRLEAKIDKAISLCERLLEMITVHVGEDKERFAKHDGRMNTIELKHEHLAKEGSEMEEQLSKSGSVLLDAKDQRIQVLAEENNRLKAERKEDTTWKKRQWVLWVAGVVMLLLNACAGAGAGIAVAKVMAVPAPQAPSGGPK